MTRILLDADLRSKLLDLSQPLELCDDAGNVVARVLPTSGAMATEDREPRISKEELQRRRQNKGKTYTTAEVLARLEQP